MERGGVSVVDKDLRLEDKDLWSEDKDLKSKDRDKDPGGGGQGLSSRTVNKTELQWRMA